MTSQAYNNNDVLLFLLQIWKTWMLMFLGLCFLELRKQQYWGDTKNNLYEEWS